jgi:hypothetical protein
MEARILRTKHSELTIVSFRNIDTAKRRRRQAFGAVASRPQMSRHR